MAAVFLEPQKIKSDTVSPSISHEVVGPDAMILVFWMLSFKPTFSLYSFTFIKRLLSSSSLSAIRVVSSAYLRLLIFLPAILIPACASSSPAFLMMYSAYKLNKQGDNIQPWRTAFPIWNQSVVPCPVLTVASWPAYRFLKKAVSQKCSSYEELRRSMAKRSYPTPKVGGGGQEEQPHVQGAVGLRGTTTCSRSGGVTSSKVRNGGFILLEQPWRDTPCPR